MSARARSVLVAYGDRLFAESIAGALARFPGIVPVGSVTTSQAAERTGRGVDAVALDARLAGAEAAAQKLRRGGVRVVMVREPDASASPPSEEEGIWVPADAPLARLASALVPDAQTDAPLHPLTARQRQILSLIEGGLPGKQVARQLGISEKTVERHKTRIFARLGVPNQTAAVSLALRRELAGR